jgi:tetratricopeptide (TPR) repeat protein
LGNSFDSLGQFEKAVEYHQKHFAIAKEVGDRAGQGRAYGNLGIAFKSLGQFEKAVEYHNKHLAIAKELGR